MAGILDFLNSPDAQLGIGLLAAGGPTTDPNQTGLGQRMQGAMNNMRTQQAAQLDLKMKQAQMDQLGFALKKNQLLYDTAAGLNAQDGSAPQPGQAPVMGGQPQGTPGGMGAPQAPGMPAQGGMPMQGSAPQQGGGVPNQPMFGSLPNKLAAFGLLTDPSKVFESAASQYAPTDLQKTLRAIGVQPGSQEWNDALRQSIVKGNYIAPASIRPGGYSLDASGNATQYPHVPEGSTAFRGPDGQFHIVPVDGGLGAVANAEAAKKQGINTQTPSVGFAGNQPVYRTVAQDVKAANGTGSQSGDPRLYGLPAAQPGMTSSFQGDPTSVLASIANIKDPQERANAADAYARQGTAGNMGTPQTVAPQLAPGQEKGAVLSQEELSGKYKDLAAANSSAPTVISRLQNIKMLAPGAITGAEASRRDFFNGLLSLAGIKGAEDSKTASDLVDKNSSQIVSALRMGQGGAGTDALQTLLGAANPNRHMTAEAINEAADQLIASQKLNQAKAKLLTPVALARDPQTYGAKELAFDQAADPRIWQWQSISDPKARKAFAASVMKNDPSFPQKIQTLEQMGALK